METTNKNKRLSFIESLIWCFSNQSFKGPFTQIRILVVYIIFYMFINNYKFATKIFI